MPQCWGILTQFRCTGICYFTTEIQRLDKGQNIARPSTQLHSIFAAESLLPMHPAYLPLNKTHYGICAYGS